MKGAESDDHPCQRLAILQHEGTTLSSLIMSFKTLRSHLQHLQQVQPHNLHDIHAIEAERPDANTLQLLVAGQIQPREGLVVARIAPHNKNSDLLSHRMPIPQVVNNCRSRRSVIILFPAVVFTGPTVPILEDIREGLPIDRRRVYFSHVTKPYC